MTRRLRTDPDYPFSEENLEATVREMERFLANPPLTPVERGEVLEFVRLTHQYAFLERLIQGEILFNLPVHLDLANVSVETLADQERELLVLGTEPAEELADSLDERGIKVFFRRRGPEPPDTLTGGFQYAGESGPSLLAGAAEGHEAIFIIAHAYGHLVMDVNPYRSRFCRWRRTDLQNLSDSEEERRADLFARALIVPQALISTFRFELEQASTAEGVMEETVTRMAEVCSVPPAVLWRRLGDLDLPRSAAAPRPTIRPRRRKVDERRATDLPERFVNLALAGFGQRFLDKADLVRFLRVPPERIELFLSWCPIPRVRKVDAEEDEEGRAREENS
jgi:Zn-dependent peptidase ImmA (M78 family)